MDTRNPATGRIMESAGKLFSNPWVIGGGLGLVVLLFMLKGSGSSSAGGIDANTASVIMANNQVGAQNYAVQAQAAVAVTNAQIQEQGTIFQSLAGLMSVNAAQYGQTQQTVAAATGGVISSSIQAGNAMAADFAGNMARSQQAVIADSSAVTVAKVSASAAKAQANANMWGSIAQSVSQAAATVGKAALAGG